VRTSAGFPYDGISSIALPGNEFYLLDDNLIVSLQDWGNGLVVDLVTTTNPPAIRRCQAALKPYGPLAIPHVDYNPHRGRSRTRPSDPRVSAARFGHQPVKGHWYAG
jgi:hypothetical protein